MLLQKQRKSTFITRALVIGALAIGTWFHPSDAYGMGYSEKIDGILEKSTPIAPTGVFFGMGRSRCVFTAVGLTGFGVEAISYSDLNRGCYLYNHVRDLEPTAAYWCSQWVFPTNNSPIGGDECLTPPGGGGGGGDDDFEENQCNDGSEEGEEECDDSPILLDLDRNQFHLSGGPVFFDIDADGQREIVTWVAPGTQDAFLFLDRNGNGVVDDGSELFGSATLLFSGEQAEQGYEALAEFDLVENGGNQDGVISDADSIFSDLGVWIDSNANGNHESHESQSLAEADVLTIGLNYRESRRTDSHGNEFRYIGRGLIEVNGRSKNMWTTDVFFKILAE